MFIQAAVADPVQPTGIALSNSVHPVARPPRVFFIDEGFFGSPPAWVAYDVLSDSAGSPVFVPAPIIDVVAVPALRWIAMVLTDGTLLAFDAATGAVTLNVPLTTANVNVQLTVSGTTLIAHESSSPNILHFVSLPLAAPPVSLTLPLDGFLIGQPVNGYVYVAGNNTDLVFPYSAATGTALPPISLSGGAGVACAYWVVHGNFIYIPVAFVTSPWRLNAIDTSTNTAVLASPVPTPYVPTYLWDPLFQFGPGRNGPALFIRDMTSAGGYGNALAEISPQTLAVTGSIPIPGITNMEPSNGGTEWLLAFCNGCGGGAGRRTPGSSLTLQRMDPGTHAVTTVGTVPSTWASQVQVLPSGSVNKAFVSTGGGVFRFDTDPTTSIIPVPLPISAPVYSVGLKVVID